MKLLHVSVEVVSLSGVYFKESTKAKNAYVSTASGIKSYPKTTVVASFPRDDQDATSDDHHHLRSLPLDLSKPTSKDASKEVVTWSSQENDKSTFHFERYFLREKSKGRRSKKKEAHLYASQSCRVQLAVCRNRRWFKLGDADIVINGEEKGAILTVPLINQDTPKSKKSKGNVIPMARLKGETLKCGLGNNASLRVVVSVSEYPNVEKILHPNLATVVSWEYDPKKAAVVKKSQSESLEYDPTMAAVVKKSNGESVSAEVKRGYLLNEQAVNQVEKKKNDQEDRRSENLETISSAGSSAFAASPLLAPSQEPSEVPKSSSKADSMPLMRPPPSPQRAENLRSLRESSTSSRSENILDRIMTVVNEPSSPQASTATPRTHASTSTPPQIPVPSRRGFSPIRVPSPIRKRNLSPFRAFSPLRQSSENCSINQASVLDRVVTITSDSTPAPKQVSLSQHLASTPPRRKGNDQSIYFIEHDMKPSDESSRSLSSSVDPPAADELNKERTRSSITMSTETSSQMSDMNSKYTAGDTSAASGFTHSQNSAFTSASGYSSSKASIEGSSNQDSEEMAVVMAELLEKTPSELYAIIHDIDPEDARNVIKRGHEKAMQKKSRSDIEEDDEDSVESDHSENSDSYESVISESSFFYESIGESSVCSSNSASYISFVDNRQRSNRNRGSFAEKIFGRRFLCNIPMCGIGRGEDDKTLSYVDDDEAYMNGKRYLLACRDRSGTSTFASSSMGGRLSLHSSEVEFY